MTTDKPIHSAAYRNRRVLNWLPMGLTYAFLYMGRYNLTVSKNALGDLMSKSDFGIIFFWGTIVYAFAFLINGPLTDRIGGRKGMLIASFGAGNHEFIDGNSPLFDADEYYKRGFFGCPFFYPLFPKYVFPEFWCCFNCQGQFSLVPCKGKRGIWWNFRYPDIHGNIFCLWTGVTPLSRQPRRW